MNKNKTLEEFYIQHRGKLLNKIKRRIFDSQEAEDVLQNAFVKALSSLDRYDPSRHIAPWFNGIMQNCIKDCRREFLRNCASSMHESYDEFNELDFPEEDRELNIDWLQVDQVKAAIDSKSDSTNTVLQLYFLYNYPSNDIAEMTGVGYGVVRQTISTFKKEMRESVE